MNYQRGVIFLTIGWAFNLLIGYFYQIWLVHHLNQAVYGDYMLVISILVWVEILVMYGIPYSVQKFIPAQEKASGSIFRIAIRLQLVASVGLCLAGLALAPVIAHVLRDGALTGALRIAFLDVLLFGLYNVFIGYFNGKKEFAHQAVLMILFAFARLVIGAFLVTWKPGVITAVLANHFAACAALAVGYLIKKKDESLVFDKTREFILYAIPSVNYFLILHLFFNIDLWMVKYFLGSESVAVYGVSSTLAKMIFYLLFSISGALLPTLSAFISKNAIDETRETIRQALRILLMFSMPVAALMSLHSEPLIVFLFGESYAGGAPILSVLIWNMTLLSFVFLFTTILNADHKPKQSFILVTISICLAFAGNAIFIPKAGALGAAWSMFGSLVVGVALTFIPVFRRFHIGMQILSFIRITAASLILLPLSVWLVRLGWHFLLVFCLAAGLYFILLFIIREITIAEVKEMVRGNFIQVGEASPIRGNGV